MFNSSLISRKFIMLLISDFAIDKVKEPAYNEMCTRGALYFSMKGSSRQGCFFREPAVAEIRQAKLLNSPWSSSGEIK